MMNLHKRSSAEIILPILILPLLLSGFTVIGCGVPATNQDETDKGNRGATRPTRGSSNSASESGEILKVKVQQNSSCQSLWNFLLFVAWAVDSSWQLFD